MKQVQLLIIFVVVVAVLVSVGFIISQVGGTNVRTSGQLYGLGTVSLTSDALLPGVPTGVVVDDDVVLPAGESMRLLLRAPSYSIAVGDVTPAALRAGVFEVTVPCGGEEQQAEGEMARLVLISSSDQRVLAQSRSVELLPPGRDCFYLR